MRIKKFLSAKCPVCSGMWTTTQVVLLLRCSGRGKQSVQNMAWIVDDFSEQPVVAFLHQLSKVWQIRRTVTTVRLSVCLWWCVLNYHHFSLLFNQPTFLQLLHTRLVPQLWAIVGTQHITSWIPFLFPNKKGKGKGRYIDVTCHMGSHSVTCHPTQVNVPRLTPAMQSSKGSILSKTTHCKQMASSSSSFICSVITSNNKCTAKSLHEQDMLGHLSTYIFLINPSLPIYLYISDEPN